MDKWFSTALVVVACLGVLLWTWQAYRHNKNERERRR